MPTPKTKRTPSSSKKKSKSTTTTPAPVPTPKLKPSSSKKGKARTQTPSPTPSARKRLRASQLAVKPSLSKSKQRRTTNTRRRLQDDLDAEAEDVDKLLQDVRNAISPAAAGKNKKVKSKTPEKSKAIDELTNAFKRADELFRDDITDSSSTDENETELLKGISNKTIKVKTPSKKRKGKPIDGNQDEAQSVDKTIRKHKKDIDALKEDDPDFFKFLEENDAGLLDLDDLDSEDDDDDDDGDDDEEEEEGEDEEITKTIFQKGKERIAKEKAVTYNKKLTDERQNVKNVDSSVIILDDVITMEKDGEEESEEDSEGDDEVDGEKEDTSKVDSVNNIKQVSSKSVNVKEEDSEGDDEDDSEEEQNENEEKDVDEDESEEDGDDVRTKPSVTAAIVSGKEDSDDESEDGDKVQPEGKYLNGLKNNVELVKCNPSPAVSKEIQVIEIEGEEEEEEEEGEGEGEEESDHDAKEVSKEETVHKDISESESDDGDGTDQMELIENKNLKDPKENQNDNDKTGYSSDEDEDEDGTAEAEAAAEAGMLQGIYRGDDIGQTDEEVYEEEESDDDSEGEAEHEPNSEEDGEELVNECETSKVTVVDLKYLRELKSRLKSKRALSACKELVKIFKAGRNILPRVNEDDKGTKGPSSKGGVFVSQGNNGKEVEVELEIEHGEEIGDDGGIMASGGKVKFVSSRAYEQGMNLAIVGIQDALDRMLGKPKSKKISGMDDENSFSNWDPTESKRWANTECIVRPFIVLLIATCEGTKDGVTLRFLLKRMERIALYVEKDDEKMWKRMMKVGVRVWAADVNDGVSEPTRLQAYLFLNCLARIGGEQTEMVLKGCYHAFYSGVGGLGNVKALRIIEFCVACLVEIFGVNMGASYAVGFTYLRELAMGLRGVLVSNTPGAHKQREKSGPGSSKKGGKKEVDGGGNVVDNIMNWAYVNQLKVWGRILGKYGGGKKEEELEPLVYPYVQIAMGVLKQCKTPRTFGMRMRVASFLVQLMRETGVMIPVVPCLIEVLRCSEMKKKLSYFQNHQQQQNETGARKKDLEWRSMLRVSEEAAKSKIYLAGLVDWVVFEIAGVFEATCRHVAMPELGYVAEVGLRRAAKDMAISEWKTKVVSLAQKIAEGGKIVSVERAKVGAVRSCVSDKGMLEVVEGLRMGYGGKKKKMAIERFYEVEKERIEREFRLRDDGVGNGEGAKEKKRSSSDGDEGEKKKRRKKTSTKKAVAARLDAEIPQGDDGEADVVGHLTWDDEAEE